MGEKSYIYIIIRGKWCRIRLCRFGELISSIMNLKVVIISCVLIHAANLAAGAYMVPGIVRSKSSLFTVFITFSPYHINISVSLKNYTDVKKKRLHHFYLNGSTIYLGACVLVAHAFLQWNSVSASESCFTNKKSRKFEKNNGKRLKKKKKK